jgi:uncharacterized protein (TIGR03067 family)
VITFKDNTFSGSVNGEVIVTGTFKLDPKQMPKTIDWTTDADEGKASLGIYEFDGDTLRICLSEPGMERPKEFGVKKGSSHVLITMKKEKK